MNDVIKEATRNLRKNMTIAEKDLWEKLKNGKLGKEFQRQKPVFVYEEDSRWNRYIIADFICLEEKLIIEIDGNIHNLPEVLELDRQKEMLLQKR
jgi:imidazole glycerol-phosphate synthase subunit HisF